MCGPESEADAASDTSYATCRSKWAGDLLDVEILEDYEDGTSFYYVTARKGCAGWLKACYVDAVAP